MNHVVFIGVENEDMLSNVIKNLKTTKYQLYIGNKTKSFSELVNKCISLCKTDKFIFCSHRVSPTDSDIDRIVELLDSGYGYVGLYRFACFGIHMDIINKIGGFDENFVGGNYEDDDFKLRLQLNDVAFFEDHSVEYRAGPSLWVYKSDLNRLFQYFCSKYTFDQSTYKVKTNIKLSENIDRSKYKRFNSSNFIKVGTIYCSQEFWKYSL